MPVQFGLSQINKPTPPLAEKIMKYAVYAAIIAKAAVSIISEIPADVKVHITNYSFELLALIHIICPMFSIAIPEVPGANTNGGA